MTTVGVLGGTGPAGRGVAIRLASTGYDIILGSRDETRADITASTLLPRGDGVIRGGTNEAAADCDIVVVATPWDSAVATVRALRESLKGKVVIYPPRGSMAAQIAFTLPESTIVGAFHHLPASEMEDLDSGLDADVVIFSDSVVGRATVVEMVNKMPGLRGVEAGSMSLASATEAFTAVCITINIRHKVHSYVKLAGLTD